MNYLEQILKEALQKIPPVGDAFRKSIQSCEFQRYRFPQSWSVLDQVDKTHDNPEIYHHPEPFNPTRFNPNHSEEKPYSYIPFGGGIGECLGKEFTRLEIK